MNEMLRSLGFGQVHANKWTNGETMMILVHPVTSNLVCLGNFSNVQVECSIEHTDPETMKRHIEKFMRMVGKCIQVDEE